jgi:hypothetical protein
VVDGGLLEVPEGGGVDDGVRLNEAKDGGVVEDVDSILE